MATLTSLPASSTASSGKIAVASAHHTRALCSSIRKGGGTPLEADPEVNDSARKVIQTIFDAHGEAILGRLNIRQGTAGMARWDGKEPVRNFEADFVLPTWDDKLFDMILNRAKAPYRGVAADTVAMVRIMDRIDAVGGVTLVWT